MTQRLLQTAIPCILALLAGGLTLLPPSARAAPATHGSVTATAAASVTILAPEMVSSTQQLSFAAVTRPANGEVTTVGVDTDGRMTVTGKGGARPRPGSAGAAGVFEIAGPANTVYSLDQSLRFSGSGLSAASVAAGQVKDGALNLLPGSGLQQVRFGGAFRIDPMAAEGSHSGYLTVTVNYN